MINFSIIRNLLLIENDTSSYRNILNFFKEPNIESINNVMSLNMNEKILSTVNNFLNDIITLYKKDKNNYYNQILYGQLIIWDEILICFENMQKISKILNSKKKKIYQNDYISACNQVYNLLNLYAQSQSYLSKLENTLGIDRYLDNINEDDIAVLIDILLEQKNTIEILTTDYKNIFQEKWNLTNVKDIMLHKLIQYNGDSQICSSLPSKQKNIILFIIDGLGLTQYLWDKELGNSEVNYTLKENIFNWLEKENCILEFVLGSSYISDTAAGLSQIFLGQSALNTGIISSKLQKRNVSGFADTKNLSSTDFFNIFNINVNSITEILNSLDINSKVLYGSRYSSSDNGFSQAIFKGTTVESVVPPERSFSIILDNLINEDSSGLNIIYYTNIDNSGHTTGAFSKFERYEHEKINGLFKNFLIELALKKPSVFNNETSIMFIADHGMAESSKVMINRHDIYKLIQNEFGISINLVENNRSLLIYNVPENRVHNIKKSLDEFFLSRDIKIEISTRLDDNYKLFICNDTNSPIFNTSPDIIIRLIDNALFYSNRNINPHLLHYGGHGGCSFSESFVPLLDINLNKKLLDAINKRFINKF